MFGYKSKTVRLNGKEWNAVYHQIQHEPSVLCITSLHIYLIPSITFNPSFQPTVG